MSPTMPIAWAPWPGNRNPKPIASPSFSGGRSNPGRKPSHETGHQRIHGLPYRVLETLSVRTAMTLDNDTSDAEKARPVVELGIVRIPKAV